MSKVAIITDSTAYIPSDLVNQYHIIVKPQVLIWDGKEYEDGVNMTPNEFYNRLANSDTIPTTSQVTVQSFLDAYAQAYEQTHDMLCILISHKLSGSVTSANQAKELFKKDANIEIFDSLSTAMALGFQVLSAARAASEGASLSECKEVAELARQNSGVVFAVDTLEFLHRGGRIGGGTRFLGTALNIKPILEVTGGRVEPIERVRTRKKSVQRVVELVQERVGDRKPIRLATVHANAEDDARMMLEIASQRLNPIEAFVTDVSPVVGTHAGPGTVGLAYLVGI
jgi:DegV family protein with EDD domain